MNNKWIGDISVIKSKSYSEEVQALAQFAIKVAKALEFQTVNANVQTLWDEAKEEHMQPGRQLHDVMIVKERV